MAMTKRKMGREALIQAELLRGIFTLLLTGNDQAAELRINQLGDADLKTAAGVAEKMLTLVRAEVELRKPPLKQVKAELRASAPAGKTVLFDDQDRQKTSSFVGIYRDDDPDKPYLAITVHKTRRFPGGQRAAKWYARTTGADYREVIGAITKAEMIEKGLIPIKDASK